NLSQKKQPMEVERMEKIYRVDGFAIIDKNGEYQIYWTQGPYNDSVYYPISKRNMDKGLNQIKTLMK
ncbi:hypothetical protein ACERJO_20730, partial [Halalkalibacter sp. AB-rgal2]